VVGDAMSADVMRSVAHLLPDVLQHIHVLLYQVRMLAALKHASNVMNHNLGCTKAGLQRHVLLVLHPPHTLLHCRGSSTF
jgi:hypothetical protein